MEKQVFLHLQCIIYYILMFRKISIPTNHYAARRFWLTVLLSCRSVFFTIKSLISFNILNLLNHN